jgi:hypothetical protein
MNQRSPMLEFHHNVSRVMVGRAGAQREVVTEWTTVAEMRIVDDRPVEERLTTYDHTNGRWDDTSNMIAVDDRDSCLSGPQIHLIRLLCAARFDGTITVWAPGETRLVTGTVGAPWVLFRR